jgi:hypothetical protein
VTAGGDENGTVTTVPYIEKNLPCPLLKKEGNPVTME